MKAVITVRSDNRPVGAGDAFIEINDLAGIIALDGHSAATIFIQNPSDHPMEIDRKFPIGLAWEAGGITQLPEADLLDHVQRTRDKIRIAGVQSRAHEGQH
jgi:hypothetical protein